jgi:electron transfer flavoprotein alpha subunit
MLNVLVIAELDDDRRPKPATFSAIGFAREALAAEPGTFSILVLGAGLEGAVEELARYGAERVITCDHPSLATYLAETYAPTVAAVAREFGLVVATATSFGKDLLPRVAARLDAAFAGDCTGVASESDKRVYRRPMFAGNVIGYCTLDTPVHVVTVRQSAFARAEPASGRSSSSVSAISLVAAGAAAQRIEWLSKEAVQSERPDLGDAKVVVSGGRALKNRFFEVLEPLADVLGAALGASRAAVDAGFAPGDAQVGQTGKIVAPQLYFAIGISGAIQHIAGMKGSKVIVAINKDPEAPIFQLADYGLVADLFDAVPTLVAELRQARSAGSKGISSDARA